ncbi:MAG: hypothetical protein CMN56_13035 [Sneathiella sp.]|uniref:hypothetical protein n=1 Tax=Sneathiella sp. TaxID=1964365 RepID=UPI000C5166E9|nr:hypothetical protein [Sneathiella sp.]MAZ04049.1 hypothetical protein [Sneathiella sp.]
MLEKILNKIINDMLIDESYAIMGTFENEKEYSDLRVKLSAEGAIYFIESIFNEQQANDIRNGLQKAYELYKTAHQELKDENTLEYDFIEQASQKCLKILSPYMKDYNQAISDAAGTGVMDIIVPHVKMSDPKRKYRYFCTKKSLAVLLVIIVVCILAAYFLGKESLAGAILISVFAIIICICFGCVGWQKMDNRWTLAVIEEQGRHQLANKISFPINQWVASTLSQNGVKTSVGEAAREILNVPGIAHLIMTEKNLALPRDLMLLTAQFVYPKEMLEYFALWYSSLSVQPLPSVIADEPSEKEKHEELKQGGTGGKPSQQTSTAGMELVLVESDSNSPSPQSKNKQVEIEIDANARD